MNTGKLLIPLNLRILPHNRNLLIPLGLSESCNNADDSSNIWGIAIDGRVFYSYEDRISTPRNDIIITIIPPILILTLFLLQGVTSGLSTFLPDSRLSLTQLYVFSHGRIPRSVFWVYGLTPYFVNFFLLLVLNNAAWGRDMEDGLHPTIGLLSIAIYWPFAVMCMKRFHDFGRSGGFFWLLLIPLLNLWFVFELGFRRTIEGAWPSSS